MKLWHVSNVKWEKYMWPWRCHSGMEPRWCKFETTRQRRPRWSSARYLIDWGRDFLPLPYSQCDDKIREIHHSVYSAKFEVDLVASELKGYVETHILTPCMLVRWWWRSGYTVEYVEGGGSHPWRLESGQMSNRGCVQPKCIVLSTAESSPDVLECRWKWQMDLQFGSLPSLLQS